jgi:hypothetical protein
MNIVFEERADFDRFFAFFSFNGVVCLYGS